MIIAVLHLKGGSGKSTIVINLAAAAHLDGLRVLGVDLDSQGSLTDWSEQRAEGSLLDGISVAKLGTAGSVERLPRDPIVGSYDLILLDCPARDARISEAAALVADLVVIPIQPGAPDHWALGATTKVINDADERAGRKVPCAYVINRALGGSRLERAAKHELLRTIGTYAGVVRQRLVFSEATAFGDSVLTFRGAEDAAHDIRQLWRTLQDTHGHPAQQTKQKARRAASAR